MSFKEAMRELFGVGAKQSPDYNRLNDVEIVEEGKVYYNYNTVDHSIVIKECQTNKGKALIANINQEEVAIFEDELTGEFHSDINIKIHLMATAMSMSFGNEHKTDNDVNLYYVLMSRIIQKVFGETMIYSRVFVNNEKEYKTVVEQYTGNMVVDIPQSFEIFHSRYLGKFNNKAKVVDFARFNPIVITKDKDIFYSVLSLINLFAYSKEYVPVEDAFFLDIDNMAELLEYYNVMGKDESVIELGKILMIDDVQYDKLSLFKLIKFITPKDHILKEGSSIYKSEISLIDPLTNQSDDQLLEVIKRNNMELVYYDDKIVCQGGLDSFNIPVNAGEVKIEVEKVPKAFKDKETMRIIVNSLTKNGFIDITNLYFINNANNKNTINFFHLFKRTSNVDELKERLMLLDLIEDKSKESNPDKIKEFDLKIKELSKILKENEISRKKELQKIEKEKIEAAKEAAKKDAEVKKQKNDQLKKDANNKTAAKKDENIKANKGEKKENNKDVKVENKDKNKDNNKKVKENTKLKK